MAYTQNESIDGLTAITPTTDDIVVTMDQAEIGVAKTSTLLSIYNLFKTTYDTVYAKYLGDADFYQYSIVRTVASGNLTVALKNYEGNDPTPTKPVKIQNQDGTIRTITSSCIATIASNDYYHFNAGSTELATKEIDYCVYIAKFGGPLISRLYHYRLISDGDLGGERAVSNTGGFSGTDTFVPIGRFNAIKGSGLTGNWSIPATSVIINRPIYDTRYLDYTPVGTGYTGGGARYRISGSNLNLIIDSTTNITGNITVPFTCTNTVDNQFITSAGTAVLPKNSNTITVATNPQKISGFYGI